MTKLGLNGPTPDPQNSAYPKIFEDDFWYKDYRHAQWALTNVGDPGDGFGCAPFVEVVPIRVAKSVVLFFNSAILSGIELRARP